MRRSQLFPVVPMALAGKSLSTHLYFTIVTRSEPFGTSTDDGRGRAGRCGREQRRALVGLLQCDGRFRC